MENKICILLTASIEPLNTIGLNRNSVLERENDYYNALCFYIKLGFPIVFCDNSMYHSKKIMDLVDKNEVEYLNFKSQNSHLGKSHGEKEIFDFVHENSKLIKSSEYIIKVTGRLIITNITQILKKLFVKGKDFSISANICRNLSYSDCRFFIYKNEFYKEYLEPILNNQLDDWNRVYFEFCLARSIHNRLTYKDDFILLPLYPKFIGNSGATNKSYKKSYFDELKYSIYYSFKNYFFKHPI
jgi:hypothetical protein